MSKPEQSTEVTEVPCEVCMKEIPKSDAKTVETHDYVLNFCGLDCYEKWRKKDNSKE